MLTKCHSVNLDECKCKTEERYRLGYSMKISCSTQHKRSLLLHFLRCLSARQQLRKNRANGEHILGVEVQRIWAVWAASSIVVSLAAWGSFCSALLSCTSGPQSLGCSLRLDPVCHSTSATRIPLLLVGEFVLRRRAASGSMSVW